VANFSFLLKRLPKSGGGPATVLTHPQPDQYPPAATARRIIRMSAMSALATLDADTAAPYASLVSVATAMDGAPLALMSRLAQHRRNVEADARVSLLFDATLGHEDPLAGARVSVMGHARISDNPSDMRRFRARHPAAFYADFEDFACFRVEPEKAHLVAGFGRIDWIDAGALLLDRSLALSLDQREAEILSEMNRDHGGEVMLYATMLGGAEPGAWEMTGIDPEGVELASAARRLRVEFDTPLGHGRDARAALAELAREARARGDT